MAVDKAQKAAGWEAEYDTIRELLSHKFGLLRFPNPLEADVREYMRQRAVATLRESYWMVFVLYLAGVGLAVQQFAAPWRLRLYPDDFQVTMWMFTFSGIAVGMVAVCIRFQRLDRWHNAYVSLASIIALICLTIGPSFYDDPELRQHASYFVIYVLFIIYGVANLRMAQGALIGFSSLGASFLILYLANQTNEMSMLVQYGVMANLVGCGNAYVLEVRDRRLYLQSRMLELEKRQLNRLSERMVQLAREDGLTGLANRRHFNDSFLVEWERARREQQSLALVFVDVDHFKAYNDNHGHLEGDRALVAVAAAIKPLARRAGDLAARYGGEEFVLLLPNTAAAGARDVADELLAAIDARKIPHKASSVGPFVSVSVGVASMIPDVHLAPSQLIDLADAALYAAKEGGRHQVVVNDLG
ncbi:MAG: diguanylate cyclase [Pseudomonadota bacterium]